MFFRAFSYKGRVNVKEILLQPPEFLPILKQYWDVRILTFAQIDELQTFLNLFDDFFQLCEGHSCSAPKILAVCPPSKNCIDDKYVLGVYDVNRLIGLIDLIQDYPETNVWTIGYLLIHPDQRNKGIGSRLLHDLYDAITPSKFRCVVQKQNEKGLNFWLANGYQIVNQTEDLLGHELQVQYILEKIM